MSSAMSPMQSNAIYSFLLQVLEINLSTLYFADIQRIRDSTLRTQFAHKVPLIGPHTARKGDAVTSVDYNKVSAAIGDTTTSPSWALEGRYTGDPAGSPRQFLAYVLGDGHTGAGPAVEVALSYQYAGYHTDTDPAKNWRCFQV